MALLHSLIPTWRTPMRIHRQKDFVFSVTDQRILTTDGAGRASWKSRHRKRSGPSSSDVFQRRSLATCHLKELSVKLSRMWTLSRNGSATTLLPRKVTRKWEPECALASMQALRIVSLAAAKSWRRSTAATSTNANAGRASTGATSRNPPYWKRSITSWLEPSTWTWPWETSWTIARKRRVNKP